MLFNTLTYAKFFAVVFALSWLLRQHRKKRLLLLLGASYFFYAHWDYRFLPLLFVSSSVDYWLGAAIGRQEDPKRRKRLLSVTVIVNLSVLGIFKYFDFGVENARLMLQALGWHVPELAIHIALPVGVSFFTFESMSYVIDVYRRELEPHDSYLEYLTFVAFFPHLVAGPIVRPRDLLPQLSAIARFRGGEASEGLFLIAVGLLKKVAIGDYLALNLVDRVFDAPTQYSALECYAAVLGYAVQIYCDFSGYTDIAIGSALLLGIRFPLNFNAPYKAVDIQDFWRRWHISLSTWLRDYLYVPLGGSRRGTIRTYVNLMITMLLGGLWHGASWNFVVWGGLHGSMLAVTRAYRSLLPIEKPKSPSFQRFHTLLCGLLTFHFVCLCWVFFRARSYNAAWSLLSQLSTGTFHSDNLPPLLLAVLATGLASHLLPEAWFERTKQRFMTAPVWAQAVALYASLIALSQMSSAESVPFVYFQF